MKFVGDFFFTPNDNNKYEITMAAPRFRVRDTAIRWDGKREERCCHLRACIGSSKEKKSNKKGKKNALGVFTILK